MSCALQNNVNVSRTLLNKANMSMLINDANNDNKIMLNNADMSRPLVNNANNDNETMLKRLLPSVNQKSTTRGGVRGRIQSRHFLD